jgi:hypothetical protein
MNKIETIKVYKTAQFTVSVDAMEDEWPDLSWDESGEVAREIDNGDYLLFCARFRVTHQNLGVIAEDYLGNCIYSDMADFIKNSGYFADMVHNVCEAARRQLATMRIPAMRRLS